MVRRSLGAAYLVAIAGDWPFVLFVGIFFAGAFWLLDGLLAYHEPLPKEASGIGIGDGRPASVTE